jgi:hypothetical protein
MARQAWYANFTMAANVAIAARMASGSSRSKFLRRVTDTYRPNRIHQSIDSSRSRGSVSASPDVNRNEWLGIYRPSGVSPRPAGGTQFGPKTPDEAQYIFTNPQAKRWSLHLPPRVRAERSATVHGSPPTGPGLLSIAPQQGAPLGLVQLAEVFQVLAPRPLICRCVQLQMNLIKPTSDVEDESTYCHMMTRLAKPSGNLCRI